ncbi:MAG: extracellular solute-binding protein, partial [Anaerolineae bacterium]|nr:extracellular solute-binding protein [Anaerolineae bacterium]
MGTHGTRPRCRLHRPLALLSLALVLLLSACGRGTPTPEPVTIVFACDKADVAYYEPLAQSFHQAHPLVTVKLLAVDGRQLQRGLEEAGVDALSASFSLRDLIRNGALLSLDPWISGDDSFVPEDFYPGLLGLYAYEGKTWAIPAGADPLVMYYNRDLCDLYEVPYPSTAWTWEDFAVTALSLRDPVAGVYGYAPTFAMLDALLFVYQHGGRLVDDWDNPTRTAFYDPLTIDALEWYGRLFRQ